MFIRSCLVSALGVAMSVSAFAEIKRTVSGKPDLSGFYDSGTLTPLNRPTQLGDKQFMTPAEAEEFKKFSGLLRSDAEDVSDPNRGAPVKGGDGIQDFFSVCV